MNYVVIMFAFALLCGVLSMLFFSGRGAKLIAGYNTSTPEQRARYDERKLCRAMGLVMVGAFFALGTMALAELARMQGAISVIYRFGLRSWRFSRWLSESSLASGA